MKISIAFPHKAKNRNAIWFSNTTLGIFLKELKTSYHSDTSIFIFIEVAFAVARLGKQTSHPWHIDIYTSPMICKCIIAYYSDMNHLSVMSFAAKMGRTRDYQVKQNMSVPESSKKYGFLYKKSKNIYIKIL